MPHFPNSLRAGSLLFLLSVVGCAGDGLPAGKSTIAVVGGADGPVVDELSQRFHLKGSSGANLANADYVLLDGDHVTATMVSGMTGLKAAAKSGSPIFVVDASEELKSAVADEIGAFATPGGESFLTVFAKIEGQDSHYRVFELPAGENHLSTISSENGNGGESLVPHTASPEGVRSMLDAMNNPPPLSGGLSTQPPSGIRMVSTQAVVYGGENYKDLDDQMVGRNMFYTFSAFLSEDGRGNYSQYVEVALDSQMVLGDQKRAGLYPGNVLEMGWLQTAVWFDTYLENFSSLNEPVDAISSPTLVSDDSSTHLDNNFQIGYRDDQGNFQTHNYSYTKEVGWLFPGWRATTSAVGNHINYTLSQKSPYNGLGGDASQAWDSNFDLASFPDSSRRNLVTQFSSLYYLNKPIRGREKITYVTKRRLEVVGAYTGFPQLLPISVSNKELAEGTAQSVILNFASIAPPAPTTY
ncbi:hypothetical protein EON81_17220 [bacterium]|nr:MAG: hypothetical protein EON81_17220 [bacterium]